MALAFTLDVGVRHYCGPTLVVALLGLIVAPPYLSSTSNSDDVFSSQTGLRRPRIVGASATCASIEFGVEGKGTAGLLSEVQMFAKRPQDPKFTQWGHRLPVTRMQSGPGSEKVSAYHVMMRDLPPGIDFQVKVSTDGNEDGASSASQTSATLDSIVTPVAPSALKIARTDPRVNLARHDLSVCVDLEWCHPHQKLHQSPSDAYFRISYQYVGEAPQQFCEDKVGSPTRSCGQPLTSVHSALPVSFTTICGLRPKRWLRFVVEAFSCDSRSQRANSSSQQGVSAQHVDVVSPTSAPKVTTTLITHPASQESSAGFRPRATLDWVLKHDPLIEGYAIYLGLSDVGAMKLLCWVPHDHKSKHALGHLELPILHTNHTHSEDTMLLHDYASRFHVHQEQELLVSIRMRGRLESPPYTFRLGNWLVREEALKCLTSFNSKYPSYAAHPVSLSWTQPQALSLAD
eukprot:CAMPEP_0197908382 /NCGR_PEP_ID=MMETSP1439-20131203/66743_1 /TAXON_ID=66791 /ORGANISM="Gonyaulax spinifera, Strain CCMP409" /LENGTH=458 /DNA_ID=CAMNT_0043529875 /DNA_START=69 /DNA_END=1445 /DNA_ORIENTATION=+